MKKTAYVILLYLYHKHCSYGVTKGGEGDVDGMV